MNTTTPPSTTSTRSLGETARETAAQVSAGARDTAAKVAESAGQYATEKKSSAADQLRSYGTAIDESAKSLEQQDPNIAWLTHQAASRLQQAADYVRERDFSGLREDAENLARRHPVAFFGGLCVAGLILGSVIKASARGVPESTDGGDDGGDADTLTSAPAEDYSTASADEFADAEAGATASNI